tara:strand:+ start:1790 stop:2074 length:285 start_codon:yes stop_codon:yes gene_type:complete
MKDWKTALLAATIAALLLTWVATAGAAHIEREYERYTKGDFATPSEYRAYKQFGKATGLRGVPFQCDISYGGNGDREDPTNVRICGLRMMGTAQ